MRIQDLGELVILGYYGTFSFTVNNDSLIDKLAYSNRPADLKPGVCDARLFGRPHAQRV